MKILFLSSASNRHTERWVNGLVNEGIEIILVSVHSITIDIDKSVTYYQLSPKAPFGYFLAKSELQRIIDIEKPDLLNAHYASGYGFLIRNLKNVKTFLSLWGSDVYLFPNKSFLHKLLLIHNLKSATAIGSTSNCMLKQALSIYHHKLTYLTPFGINTDRFKPKSKSGSRSKLIIGTIKGLEDVYGIDILIEVFNILIKKHDVDCELHIVGSGSKLNVYLKLVENYMLQNRVKFLGRFNEEEVIDKLNNIDIFCAFSRSESFGVAVLEAAAMEIPVVVSDAEGLVEVTEDGINGFVVQNNNIDIAVEKLLLLINNSSLRNEMGLKGREIVMRNYELKNTVNNMINIYEDIIFNN